MVSASPTTDRPICTVKDAARQLGVSAPMIYKLLSRRQLDHYSVGRRKIIYADSVVSFRQRNAVTAAPSPSTPAEPTPRQRRRRQPASAAQLELPERRHLR